MGIGAVAGASAASSQQPAAQSAAPGGALGETAFLQLLVAQLQYQDPLQPVDSTQFVTQLAQFQMLSDLNAMQADLDKLAGNTGSAAAAPSTSGSSPAQPAAAASVPATGSSAASGSGPGGL